MSNFKFELNRAGVGELLKGSEIQGILSKKASEIQARCGEGYAMNTQSGRTRANAMVYPETPEAYFRNLKHNTLLKAIK